jgi:hypothetical protein
MSGADNITLSDSLLWSSGVWNGTGTVTVESTALLALSGTTKNIYTRTLETAGNTVWTAGSLYLYLGGTINNQSDATFDMQGDVGLLAGTTPGPINNAGTLLRSTSTGIARIAVAVNNTGTVDAQTGTLDLNSDFTHEDAALIQGTGILDIATATYTSLSGEFDADVAGTAGTLPVTGDLVLDTVSDLNVDIGGTAGGEYDVIAVTGDVTIDGNIAINLLGGYSPNQDDEYTVMTWTGTLTANNGIIVPSGEWTAIVGASSLILRYTGI